MAVPTRLRLGADSLTVDIAGDRFRAGESDRVPRRDFLTWSLHQSCLASTIEDRKALIRPLLTTNCVWDSRLKNLPEEPLRLCKKSLIREGETCRVS